MSQRNWSFNFKGTPQACIDALNALEKNVDMPDHVIDGQVYLVQYALKLKPPITVYEIQSSGQWGGHFGDLGHVSQAHTLTHFYK